MTYARAHLVDSVNSGFYHCVSRCVRRTWLCGIDRESGRDFSHRKDWLESRILHLGTCFAVDLFGYAVMSNHYHLVLELLPQRPRSWSDTEVAERWLRINAAEPHKLDETKRNNIVANPERVAELRDRLGSLSWFMSFLNQPLARMANKEDNCKGHFWESRFKSFALLDDMAVLSSTAYVDLNPVRAHITDRPECTEHTSIARRLQPQEKQSPQLAPLERIGVELSEYLVLLQRTVSGEGSTSIDDRAWLENVDAHRFQRRAYGSDDKLAEYANRIGRR